MAEISGLGGLSSVQTLVSRFMDIERKPLKALQTQKNSYQRQLAVFTDLNTTFTKLRDRVRSFRTFGGNSKFGAKQAVSSNSSIVTAEAAKDAKTGVNTLFVSQIAKNDTVLSDIFNKNQRTLALRHYKSTQTFTIRIGDEKSADIKIEFNNISEKDSSVLDRIAEKINNAKIGITANVIKVNKNNIRLSVSSNETGETNQITFLGSTRNSILINTGLMSTNGARKAATRNKGGYIASDVDKLNARITLNGVEIVRDSNKADDIIDGLTFNFHKAHEEGDQPETITVDNSASDLKEEIKGFIEDYNKVISYINEKSSVDPDSGTRGALAGNFSISNLRIKLRGIVSRNIETGNNPEVKNLRQLGIKANRDGTLVIENESDFDEQIRENAEDVKLLFTADGLGIADRFETEISRYTKVGGLISTSKKGISSKIKSVDLRTKTLNDRLRGKEAALTKRYSALQKLLSSLNTQQMFLQRFNYNTPGGYLGYNYLRQSLF